MNPINKVDTAKKVYSAPCLTVHGDATQVTQMTNVGRRIDRAQNIGDPDINNVMS